MLFECFPVQRMPRVLLLKLACKVTNRYTSPKGFPGGTAVKNSSCNTGDAGDLGSIWPGKIPWRKEWQPTPVFLPGKSHGQRNLAGYSPWCCIDLDTTEHMLTWLEKYHNLKNGFPRTRFIHCTSDVLTPAISPNVGNSTANCGSGRGALVLSPRNMKYNKKSGEVGEGFSCQ